MLENELEDIFSNEKSGIFKDKIDDEESNEIKHDPTKKVSIEKFICFWKSIHIYKIELAE